MLDLSNTAAGRSAPGPPPDGPGDDLAGLVGDAFRFGATPRNELLTAAIAAHAPVDVLQLLLALPDRRYLDLEDVRGQLDTVTG